MSRIAAAMLHFQKIANSVVHIALAVRAHSGAIVSCPINADAGRIIVRMWNRRAADLP